jgi:hypothetical protein
MAYTSLKSLEALSKKAEYFDAVQDCTALMVKYHKAALQIGLYLGNSIDDAASGKLDANMDKLGDWIKSANRPIYLRVGYEFDFPENKYTPATYVKAFRRLRDRLDQRGVTNVAYVWHSYAGPESAKLRDWYPGDEYVDCVAVSFFSTKQSNLETVAKFAREHGKPLMIAESCPRGIDMPTKGPEALNTWFRPMFAYATRNNVKAICYINRDWEASSHWRGKGWGNSMIATNEAVKAAWLREVGAKRYLKGSDELFKLLGFVPAAK